MKSQNFDQPTVASPEKWLAARRELLRAEKELTQHRDRVAALRRELPWVKVEKDYSFESEDGPRTLAQLFDTRQQLIVYHFMYGPGWEEGCRGCSYVSDHFDGAIPHLNAKDVSFVAVSRAPLDEFLPFKRRMGWHFPWVSSSGNTFNQDFHVSFTPEEVKAGKAEYNFAVRAIPMEELPGLSVFALGAEGQVYHTYSTYSRGLDPLLGAYQLLDLTAKGRNEDPESPMSWVRHHDRYEPAGVTR